LFPERIAYRPPGEICSSPHRARGESKVIPPLRIGCGTPARAQSRWSTEAEDEIAAGSVSPCAVFLADGSRGTSSLGRHLRRYRRAGAERARGDVSIPRTDRSTDSPRVRP